MRNKYFLMDPFTRLANELDRFFPFGEPPKSSYPAVNVSETDEEVIVEALLPGYEKEQIELSYDQGWLKLKGNRDSESEEKGAVYLKRESYTDSFERNLKLNRSVDGDSVDASYENGVLSVRFKKKEQAKPKQIVVE